ncbi:MAG TPA: hypothetical protein VHL77_13430 [Ferruginibacter sp.]|nr:hypothetical protein [Ferruginibacter sp.]
MKKFALLLGSFVMTPMILQAQTAEEIVNRHIDAIGGKEVLEKITSQVIESSLNVMGSDLASTSTLLVGKGFKNVANFNGQEIIQSITPTSGWMINPLAGQVDATAMPEDQVKDAQSALQIGGALYNYAAKGSKVVLDGTENIEGVKAYKIKLTNKEGKESFYFIDPTTYYVLKTESTANAQGQDITVVSTFSNYKKTDFGYVIPYTTVRNQGFEMTINVNTVEFNKAIDPKIFDMPK